MVPDIAGPLDAQRSEVVLDAAKQVIGFVEVGGEQLPQSGNDQFVFVA